MALSRCWHVDGNATIAGMTPAALQHNAPATDAIYAGYRFPPDVISYAVWLYYRFPLTAHGRGVQELRRSEQGSGSDRRTPAAQRIEQPGGELAPANASARESDAPLQISAPSTTIHVGP
jgi:hypothetical protein